MVIYYLLSLPSHCLLLFCSFSFLYSLLLCVCVGDKNNGRGFYMDYYRAEYITENFIDWRSEGLARKPWWTERRFQFIQIGTWMRWRVSHLVYNISYIAFLLYIHDRSNTFALQKNKIKNICSSLMCWLKWTSYYSHIQERPSLLLQNKTKLSFQKCHV